MRSIDKAVSFLTATCRDELPSYDMYLRFLINNYILLKKSYHNMHAASYDHPSHQKLIKERALGQRMKVNMQVKCPSAYIVSNMDISMRCQQ